MTLLQQIEYAESILKAFNADPMVETFKTIVWLEAVLQSLKQYKSDQEFFWGKVDKELQAIVDRNVNLK